MQRPLAWVQTSALAMAACFYGVSSAAAPNRSELFETEPSATLLLDEQIHSFELADLNGDGFLDLFYTRGGRHGVFVALGTPGAGLAEPKQVFKSTNAYSAGGPVMAADVNGDGKLDLASGNGRAVLALLGDGKGGFTPHVTSWRNDFHTIVNTAPVRFGDMNEDGYDDFVAIGNSKAPGFTISMSDGKGGFGAPKLYPAPQNYASLVLTDMNGDTHLDVLSAEGPHVAVFLGRGDGSIDAGKTFPRHRPHDPGPPQDVYHLVGLNLIDADQDGRAERLVFRAGVSLYKTVESFEFDGDRLKEVYTDYFYSPNQRLQAFDLDQDGISDLASAGALPDRAGNTTVAVYPAWGKADGGYDKFDGILAQLFPANLRLADMDGDGALDAVTAHYADIPGRKKLITSTGFTTFHVLRGKVQNAGQASVRPVEKPMRKTAAAAPAPKPEQQPGATPKNEPAPAIPAEPTPVLTGKPAPSETPEWETIGFWTYDSTDAAVLSSGLILIERSGRTGTASWTRELKLVRHDALPKRASRILWPVKISRKEKRVCINAPYPTYAGYINMPGTDDDGTYAFASCKGG